MQQCQLIPVQDQQVSVKALYFTSHRSEAPYAFCIWLVHLTVFTEIYLLWQVITTKTRQGALLLFWRTQF